MILRLPDSSQEEEKPSQIECKLLNVEEKFNHVLEMLGCQSHQGHIVILNLYVIIIN